MSSAAVGDGAYAAAAVPLDMHPVPPAVPPPDRAATLSGQVLTKTLARPSARAAPGVDRRAGVPGRLRAVSGQQQPLPDPPRRPLGQSDARIAVVGRPDAARGGRHAGRATAGPLGDVRGQARDLRRRRVRAGRLHGVRPAGPVERDLGAVPRGGRRRPGVVRGQRPGAVLAQRLPERGVGRQRPPAGQAPLARHRRLRRRRPQPPPARLPHGHVVGPVRHRHRHPDRPHDRQHDGLLRRRRRPDRHAPDRGVRGPSPPCS